MNDTILVPAGLVRTLREGLLLYLGGAAEWLAILAQNGVLRDESLYSNVLRALDVCRALLEKVGAVEPNSQSDIELGRDDYPLLVLKVLDHQHQAEVARLDAAEGDGFEIATETVEALGKLITNLRRWVSSSAKLSEEAMLLGLARTPTRAARGGAPRTRRQSHRHGR